jgi:hypothetical protein
LLHLSFGLSHVLDDCQAKCPRRLIDSKSPLKELRPQPKLFKMNLPTKNAALAI